MKTVINENQRGFLFKNGKFVRMLGAGKYHALGGKRIEVVSMEEPLSSQFCALDTLFKEENIAKGTVVAEVADEQIAFHFTDGRFIRLLRAGRYAFWSACGTHVFAIVNIIEPDVAEGVPRYIFGKIPPELLY